MKLIIASIAVVLFLTPVLFAQTYSVDTAGSSMKWVGEKVTGAHNGTINLQSGSLMVDGEKMSGEFVIDMNSIVNLDIADAGYNAKLVGHLKSDDFFSVESHPTATFSITKAVPYNGENANYRVTGNLTIKGITNEISFPAQITMNDNGTANVAAMFSIDRSRWNVKYGSGSFFDSLGDKLIYDDVKFELSIVAKKS